MTYRTACRESCAAPVSVRGERSALHSGLVRPFMEYVL